MHKLAPSQDEPATPIVATRVLASRVAPEPAPLEKAPLDRCAVASAVCGLTAIVPVISQVAGLVLGVMALRRIRRARQAGIELGGRGWAVTGLVSSGFVLACWIFIGLALGAVMSLFWHISGTLDQIDGAQAP